MKDIFYSLRLLNRLTIHQRFVFALNNDSNHQKCSFGSYVPTDQIFEASYQLNHLSRKLAPSFCGTPCLLHRRM